MSTLTGKIHYPSYDGWHPAGCNPGQQFLPRVEADSGLSYSYMTEGHIAEFWGEEELEKFQVIPGEIIAKDDDGSSTWKCNLVPV